MDAQTIINRSYSVFKNYHIFMNLYAYLCEEKNDAHKKHLYPLLEKHLFSILIADPLYQDLNCLSFFINLYHFQTDELGMSQTRPFSVQSRALRDKLIAALEKELFIESDDYEKHYQFRANRLALEHILLKDYYPQLAVDCLEWVKIYKEAEHECQAYLSIRAMSLIDAAYTSFQRYHYHPAAICEYAPV